MLCFDDVSLSSTKCLQLGKGAINSYPIHVRPSKGLKLFFRFTELDGKHIDHLDYHEIYNPQNTSQSSAEEMEEQKKHSARQDEFILKHLFSKTGQLLLYPIEEQVRFQQKFVLRELAEHALFLHEDLALQHYNLLTSY